MPIQAQPPSSPDSVTKLKPGFEQRWIFFPANHRRTGRLVLGPLNYGTHDDAIECKPLTLIWLMIIDFIERINYHKTPEGFS